MLKKSMIWKIFYSQWKKSISKSIPGYTILMLIPGDLPVFLKIALDVCARQNPEHLIETLVIPDKLISGFPELLNTFKQDYPVSPIRLVKLNPVEQLITRYQNNPHINCWLQMLRGVNAVNTTHALWHDADLFLIESDFLKSHYQTCLEKRLACLGVNEPWDSWYREQGMNHLTATWELMFDVNWIRSFKPWQHRGHDGIITGKSHTFDITFLPQCLTPPERIGKYQDDWEFVHFNYVICTYRWFQKSKGSFEDDNFRLLLVRLLINAYDQSGWVYEVPDLVGLVKGITDKSNRVTYIKEETRQHYPEFRSKLQKLIDSELLDDEKAGILIEGVRPFDQIFL
ncbi:hypothetical protein [Nodularia sp. NIES-3585]|uniref:hypothetical protein n=1 Tax=Nodularia sp. NIES-3585 TaxID=1973477 RepID=UPI000B5CD8B8|nr:hypothetical protein [Nodularia sp. NIES-3585]GAX37566.1 hypothetical protein NIES3585_36110 [Nodularia sp. NIES-3585]